MTGNIRPHELQTIDDSAIIPQPFAVEHEHLMSKVTRYTRMQSLTRVATVLGTAGYPHHNCFDIAANHLEHLAGLASVLEVSLPSIEFMTHRVIRHERTARVLNFFGSEVCGYDLDLRSRRVAPNAETERGAYPASWSHGLIGFCPQSGHEIIATCPLCCHKLGWRYVLEQWQCENCGEDMRAGNLARASQCDLAEAAEALDLISPSTEIRSAAVKKLNNDLQRLGAGAAFDLGWRLAMLASADSSGPRDKQNNLSNTDKLSRAISVGQILAGWPGSTETIIRDAAILAIDGDCTDYDSIRRLLQIPHFPASSQLILQNWPINRHARKLISQIETERVYGAEASALVGVTASDFSTLANSSAIPCLSNVGINRPRRTFARKDLEQIGTLLRGAISVEIAAGILGISISAVEQLRCIGILTTPDHPAFGVLRRIPAIEKSSVEALIDCLKLRMVDVRFVGHGVEIKDAMKLIGGRAKPWGPLLAALLSGEICFGFAENVEQPKLCNIVLAKQDLSQLANLYFEPLNYPSFEFSKNFSRTDVMEYLNLNPAGWDLSDLAKVAPELLSSQYPVDRNIIEGIGNAYISKHEFAARLRVLGIDQPKRTVGPWQNRTAAGWPREQIEAAFGLSRYGVVDDYLFRSRVTYPLQMTLDITN